MLLLYIPILCSYMQTLFSFFLFFLFLFFFTFSFYFLRIQNICWLLNVDIMLELKLHWVLSDGVKVLSIMVQNITSKKYDENKNKLTKITRFELVSLLSNNGNYVNETKRLEADSFFYKFKPKLNTFCETFQFVIDYFINEYPLSAFGKNINFIGAYDKCIECILYKVMGGMVWRKKKYPMPIWNLSNA